MHLCGRWCGKGCTDSTDVARWQAPCRSFGTWFHISSPRPFMLSSSTLLKLSLCFPMHGWLSSKRRSLNYCCLHLLECWVSGKGLHFTYYSLKYWVFMTIRQNLWICSIAVQHSSLHGLSSFFWDWGLRTKPSLLSTKGHYWSHQGVCLNSATLDWGSWMLPRAQAEWKKTAWRVWDLIYEIKYQMTYTELARWDGETQKETHSLLDQVTLVSWWTRTEHCIQSCEPTVLLSSAWTPLGLSCVPACCWVSKPGLAWSPGSSYAQLGRTFGSVQLWSNVLVSLACPVSSKTEAWGLSPHCLVPKDITDCTRGHILILLVWAEAAGHCLWSFYFNQPSNRLRRLI